MPESGRPWRNIRGLARELLNRADSREPGLVENLRIDIDATIRSRTDVTVLDKKPGTFATGCGLGGAYMRRHPPCVPRIIVAKTREPRRDRFSLGHEFTHHLIDSDNTLADLLFTEPARGHALEEDVCNSAAAYLLVRGTDVDTALGEHTGITTTALADLHDTSQGSLEVCCVALANRMTEPAHILVCDQTPGEPDTATVAFTARGPDASRTPALGKLQSQLFAAAQRDGTAHGPIQLTGTGASTQRHAAVAIIADRVVCIVATEGCTSVACC